MDTVSQFMGRDADLDEIRETLISRSILLVGPRRIGKTELLKHFAAKSRPQTKAVFVDLQGATTVEHAFDRLLDALLAADLPVVNPLADRVTKAQVAGTGVDLQRSALPTGWGAIESLVQQTFKALAAAGTPRLTLLLDEVPWWLDSLRKTGPELAREALARLRYLRGLSPDLRMVLTGSIGLAGLAHEVGASADINDVLPVRTLGPLGEAGSRGLFEATLARRGRTASSDAVALAAEVAGGTVALSTAGGPSTRAEARKLLFILVDEFYLCADAGRYRFNLPLFQLWWERYGDLT